jgi:hypothetical protein
MDPFALGLVTTGKAFPKDHNAFSPYPQSPPGYSDNPYQGGEASD